MSSNKTLPPYLSMFSLGPLIFFALAFYMGANHTLNWGYGLGDLLPTGILMLTMILYIFGGAWAAAKKRPYNVWVGGIVWASLIALTVAFIWFRGPEWSWEACMNAAGWA